MFKLNELIASHGPQNVSKLQNIFLQAPTAYQNEYLESCYKLGELLH